MEPISTFRNERFDKLAGTRGREDQRAVLLSEFEALANAEVMTVLQRELVAKSVELTADFALTVTNQWYDGPFVALGAGIWLVLAQIQHRNDAASTAGQVAARVWDGLTPHAACEFTNDAIYGRSMQMSMSFCVTVRAPTVFTLQARSSAGDPNSKIKATAPAAGTDLVATRITAMRFGG